MAPVKKKQGRVAGCITGCGDCINSKTKGEWALLIFAYLAFYVFMAGWVAIHITGLVATAPERATFNGTFSYSGEQVTIGKPIYNGFLDFVGTTANKVGDDEALTVDPWDQVTLRRYEVKTENKECSTSEDEKRQYFCNASNQVRINNHFQLKELPEWIQFDCSGPGLIFGNCKNPWGDEGNTNTSAGCDTSIPGVMVVHWPNSHVFPHIMQYDVSPATATNETNTDFMVTCKISGFGQSRFNNQLAQKFVFSDGSE